jgi:hypothetical protein
VGQSNTIHSNAVMVTGGLLHEAAVCHPPKEVETEHTPRICTPVMRKVHLVIRMCLDSQLCQLDARLTTDGYEGAAITWSDV